MKNIPRKYDRLSSRIDINLFKSDACCPDLLLKEICDKHLINERQFYFLCKKNKIEPNFKKNVEYRQSIEFREKMSNANRGKKRNQTHIKNYKAAATKRLYGNNRKPGWKLSDETILKIKETNKKTWNLSNKPEKWLEKTINNPDWFKKLSISKKGRPKTLESIKKQIETKTGYSYEEWQNKKREYDKYRSQVMLFTRRNNDILIENNKIKKQGWHLDHNFSIYDGWRNNIAPELVGHYVNLRYIPAKINCQKNKKSEISLEELLKKYYDKQK